MSDKITTKIYDTSADKVGYEVELELNVSYDGGDARSQCWVSRVVAGREYTASLEGLINEGELRCQSSGNRADYIHKVPENVIALIELWAIEKGY